MKLNSRWVFATLIGFAVMLLGSSAWAQVTLPSVNLGFKTTDNPTEIVSAIKLVMILTVLTLAPAILIMMTGFTRIIIVLSFLRQALGVQQMPPNQLLVGLALFLTFFVMSPALTEMNTNGIQPFMAGKISQDQAIDKSLAPLRRFMFTQTRDADLGLFIKLSKIEKPKTRADVPTLTLVPAFVLSELKTAFQIGFIIFLQQANVINDVERDLIIDRAMALKQIEIRIEETRWITMMALWNKGREKDYLFVEDALFNPRGLTTQ